MVVPFMRCDGDAHQILADGFNAIRAEYSLVATFAPEVALAAQQSAARPLPLPGPDTVDARHLPMVTLDPATSTDLDQAFAIEQQGDDIVLFYAIADVGWFVARGSVLEAEAMHRGETIYAPDGRIPQYPEVLSEDAASLLPDGDRPAILLTVVVGVDGESTLRSAQQALVRSRTKLAYEHVTDTDVSPLLPTLVARVTAAEDRRGAVRVDLPEQGVDADPSCPGGLRLVLRQRLASEDSNSAMSLAANLAVAKAMLAARVGLFRVMAVPDERELASLRHSARALGITWDRAIDLGHLQRTLDPADPRHRAFLTLARRAGGGASYLALGCESDAVPLVPSAPSVPLVPFHSAIAATYAHATAPLRRLADRYVLDLVVELHAGRRPDAAALATLATLPAIMERSDKIASKVDSAALDLVEAVALTAREGETFSAVVIDVDKNSARIQLSDPPVRTRIRAGELVAGDEVTVRLDSADPATRTVKFSLV